MVILVCACSLFGVILIPLLNKENKFHGLYKYIYALMIALGTSALFCDAILHLIPEVDKFCSRACDSYICTFCKLHMFTTWSQNVRSHNLKFILEPLESHGKGKTDKLISLPLVHVHGLTIKVLLIVDNLPMFQPDALAMAHAHKP